LWYNKTKIDNTNYLEARQKGEIIMKFLRWLGGIVVFFWLLGLLFRIGGGLIHILLVVAAIVFLYDKFLGSRRE